MVPRRKKQIELKLRLYHGQDDDLIAWLAHFDGKPYGVKSQAVRVALRRGLSEDDGPTRTEAAPAAAVDLAAIRQVVEAAVATALGQFEGQVSPVAAPAPEEEEDDETEALLDSLGAALVLQDEDDEEED